MQISKLIGWLKKQKKINKLRIKKKDIDNLKDWIFRENTINHKKNNFFSIKAFTIRQKDKNIFQPLIVQKEEGILGIIKQKKQGKNYYLLQSNIEPGNINGVQISPTVQATKSNYLRKHGGKKTLFLDFFLNPGKNIKIISKKRLSEQGSRFLNKKNWNVLLELKKDLILQNKNYYWFSKENIRYFLNKKNIINMDTISVLSSIIKKNQNEIQMNSKKKLYDKLNYFNKKSKFKINQINFKNLKNWKISRNSMYDNNKKFFSIFFIDVIANLREVKRWEQPIISDHNSSFNGFLVSKINNSTHYLLKVIIEPGFGQPKFTSTIFEKNFLFRNKRNIKFMSLFSKKNCLMDIINSDEGGRFLKNETRNMICEIEDFKVVKLDKNFIWASHNQIIELIDKNKITIEARNLFACCNIDKIK